MIPNPTKKSLQSMNYQNSTTRAQWRIVSPPQMQNYNQNCTEVLNTVQQPEKQSLQIIKEMKKWIYAVEAASNNDGILLLSLVKLQNSLSDWCGMLEKIFTCFLLPEKKKIDEHLSSQITDAEKRMHQEQLDTKDRQIGFLTKKLQEKQHQLQITKTNSVEALRKIKEIEELMELLQIKQTEDCPLCGQLNQMVKTASRSQVSKNLPTEDNPYENRVVHSMIKGIQQRLQELKSEREMQLITSRSRETIYT